ncbi:uncharacterized protein LOC128325300 isoform X2 [Hemicordylus capensis]|uniref:uncharacterized protein LOC128325300 isoform X2 n=1 Tax=Hemicordylus capensis TaxID=884348 RepID=UPI002302B8FE|nr:uncharacterized protein LOC128325300 isoform X2 [Hemicordylus capensis]
MAQRALMKLDVLEKFEKKILKKYAMIDSQTLERVQFSPFVKKPLTFEFRLDHDVHRVRRASTPAVPYTQRATENHRSSVQSTERPKSASARQLTQQNRFNKPAVRPFSAPANMKCIPSDQKGNLQVVGSGFMILKQKQKLKPTHFSTELLSKDASSILRHTDMLYDDVPAGASAHDGKTTVTVGKGDKRNQFRNEVAWYPERDGTLRFRRHDHLLPDDRTIRKYTLLEDGLTNQGEKIMKSNIYSKGTVLKEKKALIPLCIEDEIEKPNAKIIKVHRPSAQQRSPMKASETYPIFCNNDGYMQKYVLNRWLALYGDKAFYDASKKSEVHMHLNPVLQNNYNESIAILGKKNYDPSHIPIKRNKKSTFSRKKEIISIIMERERYIRTCSRKERPLMRKMGKSLPNAMRRHTVLERKISQTIPKCRKDAFMVFGANPDGEICHDTSPSNVILEIKPQVRGYFDKSIEKSRRKELLIYVDYIPISKPIPINASGSKLAGQDLSHSTSNSTVLVHECTKTKPNAKEKSAEYHNAPSDNKPSLDEGRLGGLEFSVSRSHSVGQEGSERSIRPTSSLALREFSSELNNDLRPSESGVSAIPLEEESMLLIHSPLVSIPTAQDDSAESSRRQSIQKTTNT